MLVFVRNTWNHLTVFILFLFDKDTWYHIIKWKISWETTQNNVNIDVQWIRFPNLLALNNSRRVDMMLKLIFLFISLSFFVFSSFFFSFFPGLFILFFFSFLIFLLFFFFSSPSFPSLFSSCVSLSFRFLLLFLFLFVNPPLPSPSLLALGDFFFGGGGNVGLLSKIMLHYFISGFIQSLFIWHSSQFRFYSLEKANKNVKSKSNFILFFFRKLSILWMRQCPKVVHNSVVNCNCHSRSGEEMCLRRSILSCSSNISERMTKRSKIQEI